jgi:hypothetical protein
MKPLHFLFLIALSIFIGRKKEDSLMETSDTDMAMEINKGEFQSSAHSTTGTVKIESDGTVTNLVFTNFKTDSGPDLRVYLSKDKTDASIVDLGKLKATSGAFFYEVPSGTDLNEFTNVLIWCKDFSVLFGYAT